MFEGVTDLDLSGVTGAFNYNYDSTSAVLPSILIAIGMLFVLFALGYLVLHFTSTRKSKEYRELLADMYVVGMTKKFAKEDNIDLLAELAEFNKIIKKTKLKYKYLDEIIEEGLSEKIDDEYAKIAEKNEKH